MQKTPTLLSVVLAFGITLLISGLSAQAGSLEKRSAQLFHSMQQSRTAVAALLADDLSWKDLTAGVVSNKAELLEGLSAEWAVNLRRQISDVVERGDVVTLTITQTSDLHRALGLPADVERVSLRYRGGKVVFGQVEAIGERLASSARFVAFQQWLQQRHAEEARELLPAGRMPPSGELAKRVLVRAGEWAGSSAAN
ncbi:MAG: hypothetical protein U0V87_00925 [Acidobacteriota bacterium]